MKKLILLALTALMMAGCSSEQKANEPFVTDNYFVCVLDSCEYIKYGKSYGFQHKGNCKFCEQRRQKELEELVIKLKEK